MPMCRNIRQLHNFAPPATSDEVYAASLQYVRKVAGSTHPSQANREAFDEAVAAVAAATAADDIHDLRIRIGGAVAIDQLRQQLPRFTFANRSAQWKRVEEKDKIGGLRHLQRHDLAEVFLEVDAVADATLQRDVLDLGAAMPVAGPVELAEFSRQARQFAAPGFRRWSGHQWSNRNQN